MINITEESIDRIKNISDKMEGKTFHLHIHLLYDLRTMLGDNLKKYLEIGCYSGGSVSLVSSHDYPTECYGIDLGYPIEPEIVKRNVDRFRSEKSSFEYIQGNSQSQEVVDILKNKISSVDMLFIDGDHTKNGVISDFNNYSHLVNPGGYIIFDDYLDKWDSPEVKPTVDEIARLLDTNIYEIIGSIKYKELEKITSLEGSNLFILRKMS